MSPYDPVWKRELPSAADDAANVMSNYQQQLQLNFKPKDATPEEAKEWQEKELNWWGEKQLMFVFIASLIQLGALGFMLTMMMLIGVGFK